jgi:hypothetical protein
MSDSHGDPAAPTLSERDCSIDYPSLLFISVCIIRSR